MSSPFSSSSNYDQICRGCLYWAIAPFQPQDPVQVFRPHPEDRRVGIASPDPGLFDSGLPHPVLVEYKKRPVMVVESDKVNHATTHHYTIVALAYSFEDKAITPEWYRDVVDWKIPYAAYIPSGVINKLDGYVDLGNLLMIHKSTLLERITNESPFTGRQQMAINERMKQQLGLDGAQVAPKVGKGPLGLPLKRT